VESVIVHVIFREVPAQQPVDLISRRALDSVEIPCISSKKTGASALRLMD
jgi:hypothetical protein